VAELEAPTAEEMNAFLQEFPDAVNLADPEFSKAFQEFRTRRKKKIDFGRSETLKRPAWSGDTLRLPENWAKQGHPDFLPGGERLKAIRAELFSTPDPSSPRELPWNFAGLGGAYANPEKKITLPTDQERRALFSTALTGGPEKGKLRDRVSKDSRKILNWHDDSKTGRNVSAVHANQKTGLSIDFSTICPLKCSKTGPCVYCYVEHGRILEDLAAAGKPVKSTGMPGKGMVENPYRGEIKLWPNDLVREINSDGGLRMFSFGDFRPGIDDDNVRALLGDAEAKGLLVRAITKQFDFVDRFGDHPNLRINISTDPFVPREISNAPTIDQAVQWAGGRENVKIRTLAFTEDQARELLQDPRVNVVTLYHGPVNVRRDGQRHDTLFQIVMEQNPALADRMGGEDELKAWLDTWQDMDPKTGIHDRLTKEFGPRVCCAGGNCPKDVAR
jgi:hypothetical protein